MKKYLKKWWFWLLALFTIILLIGIVVDLTMTPEEKAKIKREKEISDSLEKTTNLKKANEKKSVDSLKAQKENTEKEKEIYDKKSKQLNDNLKDMQLNIRGFLTNTLNIQCEVMAAVYPDLLTINRIPNSLNIEVKGNCNGKDSKGDNIKGNFIALFELLDLDNKNKNEQFKVLSIKFNKE